MMCRVLQVARAGFYAWLQCLVSDRSKDDTRLLDLIRPSYAASHGVYGARRVFGDLHEAGERCGQHRVELLMQRHEIKAVRGYKTSCHCRAAFNHRAQPSAARVHGRYAQQGLGYRHHLHPNLARLAVPSGGSGPLSQGRGLVHEGHAGRETGARRFADGSLTPQASTAHPGLKRPGQPIWKRWLQAFLCRPQPLVEHEQPGQLLGQCSRRVILQ